MRIRRSQAVAAAGEFAEHGAFWLDSSTRVECRVLAVVRMNPPPRPLVEFHDGQWIQEDMTPNDQDGDSTPEDDAGFTQSDSKKTEPKTSRESSGKSNPDSPDEPRPGRAFGMMPLLVIGCLLMLVWFLFNSPTSHGTGVPHNFFQSQLLAGNVKSLTVYHMAHGDVFTGHGSTSLKKNQTRSRERSKKTST